MARDAERPVVFDPAASTTLNDWNDVIRLPERRRVPAIYFTVATFREFGTKPFPTSSIHVGGFSVTSGAEVVSFRFLADPVDYTEELLRIETANATNRVIAAMNEYEDVCVRGPNPKFISAVV
jgi:hypothetical protein